MRRIKICQLITTLGPAGAERCVCQLAGKLDKSRFDVSVVSLMGGAVEQEIKRSGVPVVCLDMRCKYDIFRFARLGAVLKWLGPDILHTHLFHADFAGRIFSFFSGQRRLVTTVHVAEMRFRPWQFVIARLLSGCCDKTICVSPSVMEFHSRRSGLPRSRYHIIMNGVDTSVFVPDASGGGEFRRRMSIPADELTLSFAGRLDRQKGLDVLFDALRILSRQGRRLNLLIAGDGPLRPMLEEFLRSIPPGINARYLGHINNVAEMFAASDIFVMPSRWEGYGLSAAEAMSVAIPVIGTRSTDSLTLYKMVEPGYWSRRKIPTRWLMR